MKSYLTLILACFSSLIASAQEVRITDADLVSGVTYNWTSNNIYILDGLVFLEADGVLNIEAGTVIRGAARITTGDNTSALIISRGAQIFARGTASAPVIFTAEDDDLSTYGDFVPRDRGEWGGLIILGSATVARPDGQDGVEGIDADEARAQFGGTNDEDNSGVLNYVSIRHGGAQLSPNNEINGLTLGGVGSGTEIDYIEVFANLDDGIEFFGGTVKVTHAATAFCGDDAFDYDFGWRGSGQFWFSLQSASVSTGRAGEHDGAKPDELAPFSNPTIYNVTYVGIGKTAQSVGGDAAKALPLSVLFRDNAGGTYANSIFTDYNGAAIAIEDRDDTSDGDSFARLQAGDLNLKNNLFFDFGRGTTAADIFFAVNENEEINTASSAVVVSNFTAAGNQLIDPELNNAERGELFDPRPFTFGTGASGAPAPTEAGIEAVDYYGAFASANGDGANWLKGWSAISNSNAVFDFLNGVDQVESVGLLLDAPVPNPATDLTRINFELPRAAEVTFSIIDVLGRSMGQFTQRYNAGPNGQNIEVTKLANGNYIIVLDAEGSRLSQQLVVRR